MVLPYALTQSRRKALKMCKTCCLSYRPPFALNRARWPDLWFSPPLAGALVCFFAGLRHGAADHCFFWILYLLVCIVHTLLLNPYTVLP